MNSDEIIFLLGAGASYDANIPISSQMIKGLEELIENDKNEEWSKFDKIYYCIKSGIKYGFGITNKNEEMNIELLVNTMDELIKCHDHLIYPFVGSWVPRLIELAGEEFVKIKEFRKLINNQLKKWMDIHPVERCDYYNGLLRFQKEFQHPLSFFSLNYDLCLEKQCDKNNIDFNRGFNNYIWDHKNLEKPDDAIDRINLFKLHGSIDWELTENGVEEKDGTIEKYALIFGTSYKLQYIDPFLYLFYRFRQLTLESATKIINCIGYSFNDDHVNGILGQALRKDCSKKIISVQPITLSESDEKKRIKEKLNLDNDQNIYVENLKAKDFLENHISTDFYKKYTDTNDLPY